MSWGEQLRQQPKNKSHSFSSYNRIEKKNVFWRGETEEEKKKKNNNNINGRHDWCTVYNGGSFDKDKTRQWLDNQYPSHALLHGNTA